MRPKFIRHSVFYFLLALTLGVVGFYLTSATRLAISIGVPVPTPKPTPTLIPMSPLTIDFDYQIISSYKDYDEIVNISPTVISSRVELEEYYHSAYKDHFNYGYSPDIPGYYAIVFQKAIEVYDDTFFAENYIVVFQGGSPGGSGIHEVAWINDKGDIIVNWASYEMYTKSDTWQVVIALNNSFKPKRFKIIEQNLPIRVTPTPIPAPTRIPIPATTIDFDYQILTAPESKYTDYIPKVISSRAELEIFYNSEFTDGSFIFWEAIELYTDAFFKENYLVIFTSRNDGGSTLYEIAWVDDSGNILLNYEKGYLDAIWGYIDIIIELGNRFKPEQFNIIWQQIIPENFTPTRTLAPVIENNMLDDFWLYENNIEKYNREDLYVDWYLGRYSGCEVAIIGGIRNDAESDIDNTVYVYKDASFMFQADAHEAGWITLADVERINRWRLLRAKCIMTKQSLAIYKTQ